ncbi:MAG TPA: HNH endonuclease [Solirubrobacteraceae bacterium]
MTQPGESVEGITVPLGDPDALLAAGKQLEGIGMGLEATSSQIARMPSLMSSWAGPGSSTFADLTGHQSTTVQSSALQVMMAGTDIAISADALEDAQTKARKAIVRAKRAREEINDAKEEIRQAIADQRDAQDRMTMATIAREAAEMRLLSSAVDSLLGDGAAQAAIDAANTAYANAEKDLHEAERREKRARVKLKHAEDDLRDARKDGQDAADDAETTGIILQSVLRTMPAGILGTPGAPSEGKIAAAGNVPREQPRNVPISEMEPPDDWAPWKKALFHIGRGEMTVIAGTAGLAKKAYDNPEKIPGGLAAFGKHAYDDPLGTTKAFVGYDELANGRYFDWFGQMGLGALTGGAGTAASRGARLTRIVGPAKVARLGPNAPRWSAPFAGRKVDFSKPDLGARPGTKVTIPANREALAAAFPDGVRYTRAGYPIFTPHSAERVAVDGVNGDMAHDAPLANKAAGLENGTPRGFTWHHVEDGKTMELVPTKLHKAVPHTGGRAALPDQINVVTPGSAFTPFERGAGVAGGLGGTAVGGPATAP